MVGAEVVVGGEGEVLLGVDMDAIKVVCILNCVLRNCENLFSYF